MRKIDYSLILNRIYVSALAVISVIDLIQSNVFNAGIHLAVGNILITLPSINQKTILRLGSIAISLTIIFVMIIFNKN